MRLILSERVGLKGTMTYFKGFNPVSCYNDKNPVYSFQAEGNGKLKPKKYMQQLKITSVCTSRHKKVMFVKKKQIYILSLCCFNAYNLKYIHLLTLCFWVKTCSSNFIWNSLTVPKFTKHNVIDLCLSKQKIKTFYVYLWISSYFNEKCHSG